MARRKFLPALRTTAHPARDDSQVKVVLGDYYGALTAAGWNSSRSRPWPVERAVSEGYERIIYVFRSVEAIAGQASRLPFRLKEDDEEVDDHPLYAILNHQANPMETGRQFRKRLGAQILLSKRGAFVEVSKARNGTPLRMDLLAPGRTRPVPGENGVLIDHYETVRADGTRTEIPAEQVIWFREPHPLDPYSGVTPLEAAGHSAELDFFARLYNVQFLKNDARPGGVLAINGDMDPDEMDRIEDKFGRGPAEAGKLTVIAGDVSYVDSVVRPRDMQYLQLAGNAKNEILCVAVGTLVITKRGTIPVEDIVPGELVLTHKGRWRPVKAIAARIPQERVCTVTAKGLDPLILTETHPVHVMRYHVSKAQRKARLDGSDWQPAGGIRAKVRNVNKPFDALTLPQLDPAEQCAELDLAAHLPFEPMFRQGWGSVSRRYDNEQVHSWHKKARSVPRRIKLDNQFGRLLGLYLAEGHTINRNGVAWSFHEDETGLHAEVAKAIQDIFGLTAKIEPRPGKCKQVIVRNWAVAEMMISGCGTGALNKRIPSWAWHGDHEFLAGMLTGWADGDGNIDSSSGRHGRMRATTKSPHLAWGMRIVATTIGIPTGITAEDRQRPAGRSYKGYPLRSNGPAYVVSWRSGEQQRPGTYRIDDGHLTSPVQSVETSAYDGPVYNLSVAEDESYVTTSGTVHNCAFGVPESVMGYAADRTYSNASQEHLNFWLVTMPPHLDLQISGFDQLSEPELEGFFDVSTVEALQAAEAAKRAEKREEYDKGLISPDEYRVATGLEPFGMPATRCLYISSAMTPVPTSKADEKALSGAMLPAAQPGAQQPPPDDTGQDGGGGQDAGQGDGGDAGQGDGQGEGGDAGQGDGGDGQAKALPAPRARRPRPAIQAPYLRLISSCTVKAASAGNDDGDGEGESVPDSQAHDRLEAQLAAQLTALATRWGQRTVARLTSPKARKGTRHWTPDVQYKQDIRIGNQPLDASQAVDGTRWQDEAQQAVAPVIEAAAAAAAIALAADLASPGADPAVIRAAAGSAAKTAADAVVAMVGAAAAGLAAKTAALVEQADQGGQAMGQITEAVQAAMDREVAVWAPGVAAQAATATIAGARDGAAQAVDYNDHDPHRQIVRVWRSRRDAKVRETHQVADGQRQKLGAPFIVGDSLLRYPGDPLGPPAQTYNCRCVLNHRAVGSGQYAPTPAGQVTRHRAAAAAGR